MPKFKTIRDLNLAGKRVLMRVDFNVPVEDGRITVRGRLADNGLTYEGQVLVVAVEGNLLDGEDSITVRDARAATVLFCAGTDYADRYPHYRGDDPHRKVSLRIDAAAAQPYAALRMTHVSDHAALFDRVRLDIGQGERPLRRTR